MTTKSIKTNRLSILVVAAATDMKEDIEDAGPVEYQLDEIDQETAEVMRKYDINGDGILSKDEIDITYRELREDMASKVKEMKIDIDELNMKQEEQKESERKKSQMKLIVLSASAGAVVLIIIVVLVSNRRQTETRPPKPVDLGSLRKARLNRLAGISTRTDSKQTNISAETSSASNPSPSASDGSVMEANIKPADASHLRHRQTSTTNIASQKNNEHDEIKNDSNNSMQNISSTQRKISECKKENDESSIKSNSNILSDSSSKTESVNRTSTSSAVHFEQVSPKTKSRDDGKSAIKIISGLLKPIEKVKEKIFTRDKEKLRSFLSDIFKCNVEISEGTKARYTIGVIHLPSTSLPSNENEMVLKLPLIFNMILVRQINKISFSVSCFARSQAEREKYCDYLVESAANWIENEVVDVILKHLQTETVVTPEEDLWAEFGDKTSVNEVTVMLWRLAGVSEDQVGVPQELLSKLLQHKEIEKTRTFLSSLVKAAAVQLNSVKAMDEIHMSEGRTLQALEILFSNPNTMPVLADILERETEMASNALGNFFQKDSIFGPLLSLTSIPKNPNNSNLTLHESSAVPFTSLRGFPKATESDVLFVENVIQKVLRQCQNIVYSGLKKVVTNKDHREKGLAWLASVICLNDMRAGVIIQGETQSEACCSDGYMLNFCGVILEFFLPIYSSPDKLSKIDFTYSTSDAGRLNYDFEDSLAGGQIVSHKEQEKQVGSLPTELQGTFNFLTECYHLTQRALSIGIIPAVNHYNKMHREYATKLAMVKGTPQEEAYKNHYTLLTLMWDTSLLDEELIRNTSMFYLTQAKMLLKLLSDAAEYTQTEEEAMRAQQRLFVKLPEYPIKDMSIWFRFVTSHAVHVRKNILSGLSLVPFVDCCVKLLQRPDLMPGPIPASKVVSALFTFVHDRRNNANRHTGWGSGIISDLSAIVHTCPSVQEKLGPALLHTYVSVDVVEGLDVDKDEFDKYSSRSEIGLLIENLWTRSDCRASIIQHCGTKLFSSFLSAILDTLLYMLHDSLARLANVKKIQSIQDDESQWEALSMQSRMEKSRFLQNEERVAKGFMGMANQTLGFIDLLSHADEVARCFTEESLAGRAASAICGFLEALCGNKAKDFKVKDMSKYNFNPEKLLQQIMNIVLRISHQESSMEHGYVVSMASDPDFDGQNLEKALSVLAKKSLTDEATYTEFEALIVVMKQLNEERKAKVSSSVQGVEADWQKHYDSIDVNTEAFINDYISKMSPHRFGTTPLQESHSYQGNLQELDVRSPKAKVLMKEMKQLQTSLPVHPHASIYVKQDPDRMDVMRALITGPMDSPYSLGCFLFDVYFPASYPNNPPLVKLITTGRGTVRFNPNLYSDGKVCLSLLGTWHAGDASQKWNPAKSSFYQVALSIQGIILIPDPVFNEPGYEERRGTTEGNLQSLEYNRKIRLWTARHAMVAQLKYPPTGFEIVIKKHFYLQKDAILNQCSAWLRDCENDDKERQLRKVVDELRAELEKLDASVLDAVESDDEDDDDDDADD